MTGYEEFLVVGVDIDTANKKITILFNKDVKQEDVNLDNIMIVKKINGEQVYCDFEVLNKKVVLTLKEYPVFNVPYILFISPIRDVVDENLASNYTEEIVFKNTVLSTVDIISPSNFEELNVLNIKWQEKHIDTKYNSYYIEVSSDIGFNNIVLKTNIAEKEEITLTGLSDGQYYVRCRVQNEDGFGAWSKTVSFYLKKSVSNIPNIMPVVEMPFKIVSSPDNGETPKSIILEFNDDIDEDSLNSIMVFKRRL